MMMSVISITAESHPEWHLSQIALLFQKSPTSDVFEY